MLISTRTYGSKAGTWTVVNRLEPSPSRLPKVANKVLRYA